MPLMLYFLYGHNFLGTFNCLNIDYPFSFSILYRMINSLEIVIPN